MARPDMWVAAVVLAAPDAHELAAFYGRLLGWEVGWEEPDWVILRPPDGRTALSFQTEPDHVTPVWPSEPGEQQTMLHLDIAVDDLDAAVAWASEAGATEAGYQPQEGVRVMIDPAGHPFCLFPPAG